MLEMLKAKLHEIQVMSLVNVEQFERTLSISDLDKRAKAYLYKACDVRREELEGDPTVVVSEFDLEEE